MTTALSVAIFMACIIMLMQCAGVFVVVFPIIRCWFLEKFVEVFGWFVSRLPVFKAIAWYAKRTPHTHLYDTLAAAEDGDRCPLYMGRWRVVDRGTLGSRLLKLVSGFESCRLHFIARPDHDRELHNHPFRYRTFVLDKWYVAKVQTHTLIEITTGPRGDGATRWWQPINSERVLQVGDSDSMGPGDWHRIAAMHPDGVWTLFFMTDNTEEWGFLTQDGYVESREYFRRKRAD